ncbi:hypothetical protein MBM_06087 [Drepanopeziza brunnea f. sp. 'multigermtubi' MB_m1]|uniref:Uncharacterized protein n=1 Tax=Marssonina brunnea f. sp. multigermtubi (strain MB_m1) TaxID=1072389 RepID=K1WSN9_MARBU|nr:uncharacterized protein MBM_06087 [Drepanopeziza brunnea f. sp. 'multigermtubi' MB_m1]EKD16076.1 hypothetical protein MBM_06087 [Drepanopeziza brunnea f. sp. 'multigermtubi' MB_m1]
MAEVQYFGSSAKTLFYCLLLPISDREYFAKIAYFTRKPGSRNTENFFEISNIEVGAASPPFSLKSFEFVESSGRILIGFGPALSYFDPQPKPLLLPLSETLAPEMPFKMNTGLKIYTTLLPFAPLALPLSLALVIIDLAILHAFMTTRMLLLSAPRAPCFSSTNITDFIEKYEETYSIAFLQEFAMQERDVNDLKNYCRTFFRVSERLISMHLLSKTEQSRLFLLGLPVGIRNKTIKHYKVDELDLDSYAAFDDFVAFALKTDQSAKTIEAINRKKSFLANFTKDIRTLIKEHTEPASVLEFAKKALVVVPFTRKLRFTSEKKGIDKTKSLTQLLDVLSNLSLKFDSKTTTKPLLSIPLKMPEVRSASEVEFRLLLSATDYKDEEEEKVENTKTKCKTMAFARTPKTQLKLFINTEMSPKELTIIFKRLVDTKNINAIKWINTLSYLSSIKVASVEINAAAKDKAKKLLSPSKRSKLIKIKKNIRQQKEKNYGTFKACAS